MSALALMKVVEVYDPETQKTIYMVKDVVNDRFIDNEYRNEREAYNAIARIMAVTPNLAKSNRVLS